MPLPAASRQTQSHILLAMTLLALAGCGGAQQFLVQRPPNLGQISDSQPPAQWARNDAANPNAPRTAANDAIPRPAKTEVAAARGVEPIPVPIPPNELNPPRFEPPPATPPTVEPPPAAEAPAIPPAEPNTSPIPTPTEPPVDPLAQVRALTQKGTTRLATLKSYSVGLRRQERVGDLLQPEEVVVVNIRRDPLAVRLDWPEGSNKGREVIFDTAGDQQLHVHTPGGLLPPLTLSPDSPLIARNSRHPIQTAGLETVLNELARTLQQQAAGTAPPGDVVRDGGEEAIRPDGIPCRKIVRRNARGETWIVGLDPSSGIPLVVYGATAQGDLIESHRFFDFRAEPAELATLSAFSPDERWGAIKSVLPKLPLNLLSGGNQNAQPEPTRR